MLTDKFIMGVSAGIGGSIAEAEKSLFKAKKRKREEKIDIYATKEKPPFYIEIYNGNKKPDGHEEIDPRVEDYMGLLRYLEKAPKGHEYIDKLEKIVKYDLGTTALTPLGYRIERNKRDIELEKMRKKRKTRRHVILFDVNDMKYWNEKGASYEIVSEHLNVIGKAFVENCRTHKDGTSDFVAQLIPIPLVNRKHGDAGDEFIVDLYCPKKYILEVTERLIKAAYNAQRKMKDYIKGR